MAEANFIVDSQGEVTGNDTPLRLKDGAEDGLQREAVEAMKRDFQQQRAENERRALYGRLGAAMHIMRSVRLPEASRDEFEQIKALADADTQELTLPAVVRKPQRPVDKGPTETRESDRQKRDRQLRSMQDASRRLNRGRSGGRSGKSL